MTQGPYCTAAFFCESLIEGKDNVLTAVRIVDTIKASIYRDEQKIQHVPGERLTSPSVGFQFTFVVQVKSDDFRGRGKVNIRLQSPSDRNLVDQTFEIELLGNEHGQNLILQGVMPPEEKGVYWFEVYFEGRLLTRSPLSVRLEESSSAPTSKSGAESGGV